MPMSNHQISKINRWNISYFMDLFHIFDLPFEHQMKISYTIISEEMVWLYYYDKFRNKHFKELLAREAREFIKQRITANNNEGNYQLSSNSDTSNLA